MRSHHPARGQLPLRRAPGHKQRLDEELLRRLYQECQGRIVRVHEKLVEEEGVAVTYSTLTQMLRELGISQRPKCRCQQVPDEPGVEMQHDTTVYQVELAGRRSSLVASLIYLRYSKRRYLKFYRAFDRFKMKCFFHEALMFWGYSARQCIIDNTNLARLRGTGANAVIVPEMEAFAKQYGFVFRCHALKHPNRKAGEETELLDGRNQLPARTHLSRAWKISMQQAWQWSTVRMDNKPQGKPGSFPPKPSNMNALTSPSCRPICPPPIEAMAGAPTNTASWPLAPIIIGCRAPDARKLRSWNTATG